MVVRLCARKEEGLSTKCRSVGGLQTREIRVQDQVALETPFVDESKPIQREQGKCEARGRFSNVLSVQLSRLRLPESRKKCNVCRQIPNSAAGKGRHKRS